MSSIQSPNMNLIIPTVGQEPGPLFATDINQSLTVIDQHDHTSGSGVPITPAALDINTDLSLSSNFITDAAGITLVAQIVTPAVNTIYENGVDLYFVDGLGNNIRITQSGGIAGSPGSISNLVSPASASYVSGSQTFVWQSDVSIAANMDAASLLMRNISPNSTFALTLQPPAALSSNYSLTLPSLPSETKFMAIDTSGVISGLYTVDNVTVKLVTNQLVAQKNVLSPYREHAWELNGDYPGLTFPLLNIDSIFFAPANIVITSVWIYSGTAGGSGTTEFDLKVGSSGTSFTSILTTTGKITSAASSNSWTDSGSVYGPQTGMTKPVLLTTAISAGQGIKFDLLQSMASPAADARIRIYYQLA